MYFKINVYIYLFLFILIEDALYDDVVHDFDNDYDRENPVHKKKALEKWIEGRKQKTEK